MNPLNVAITGARGYAGGHIASAVEQRGHRVIELVRQPAADSNRPQIAFDLERGVEPDVLKALNVNALIHVAWDFRQTHPEDIRRVNRDGAVRLFDAFMAAGVENAVFISTIAAFDGCRSEYGRVKLEAERAAIERGFWVVRPGLIQGGTPGGIVGTLSKLVRRLPVVPILGYGKRILNPISADVLSSVVARLVEEHPSSPEEALVLVAQHRRLSLDAIVRDVAKESGLGPRLLVPVPWQPVWLMLRTMESLGLSIGLRSDSVISLMNQDPAPPIRPRPWFTPEPAEV